MDFLKTGRIVEVERGAEGVVFVLEDGVRCRMSRRAAASLRFWLKVGQLVEVEGKMQGAVFVAGAVHLFDDAPAGGFVPRRGRAGAVARVVRDVVRSIEALFE